MRRQPARFNPDSDFPLRLRDFVANLIFLPRRAKAHRFFSSDYFAPDRYPDDSLVAKQKMKSAYSFRIRMTFQKSTYGATLLHLHIIYIEYCSFYFFISAG